MIEQINLPPMLRQGVDPESPDLIRMAFARGEVPMGAPERLGVLTCLFFDASDSVKNAALKSLVELEDEFIEKALTDQNLQPVTLEFLLNHRPCSEEVKRQIASHPNVGEKLIHRFALTPNEKLLDALSQNQRALTKWPEAAKELLENPNLELAIKGRLASLLDPEPEPEPEPEPAPEPTPEPEPKAEASGPGPNNPGEFDEEEFAQMQAALEGLDLEEELPEEVPESLLSDAHIETDSKNVYQLIQGLTIAEKIKLATLGSKSARRLLARDTNRVVANAVIRSPKIQEDEVVALAQDKTTPDDVILYILIKKEWLKNYQVRLGLCQNPKTPLPRAMRMLETLQERDLRSISKSKNVSSVISSSAVRILARRHKK